jgi:hypothetical protein
MVSRWRIHSAHRRPGPALACSARRLRGVLEPAASEGTQENSNDAPFSLNSLGAAGMGGSPSFANPFQDIAGTPGASYPTNSFPYTVPKPGPNVNFSSLYPLEMDNLTAEFGVPYTYNFNLNVQRALPSNMVLTVGYVGSLGRKLIRAGDGNRTTQAGHDACLSGTGTGARTAWLRIW